jgi:hypothetical protein
MKLAVFNGSPRGRKSNSGVLLEHFLRGFLKTEGNTYDLYYLNQVRDQNRFSRAFGESDSVLLAYPLYVDAMPGLVKEFIESIASSNNRNPPSLGFIVQSGFPEANHSRPVERYNERLAHRLGSCYLGTIVKGGVEGVQVKPPWMTRKLLAAFITLGETFGSTGIFDPRTIRRLARPERLSFPMRLVYYVLSWIGLVNFFWDSQLKQNGAFERRFAQPYA